LENRDAPVGSLIMRNGEIIAEGIESVKAKNDPTAHAEIVAIRAACDQLQTLDLSDYVLFTNVEPCWMCASAIRQTQIKRIVFGIRNEKIGGYSSKFQVLMSENLKLPLPDINGGILREESNLLLTKFQKTKETKL
jgi:tRNA(adenine34) deaminase